MRRVYVRRTGPNNKGDADPSAVVVFVIILCMPLVLSLAPLGPLVAVRCCVVFFV